jgi:nucleoside-diphosphate-sugar epimerase
MISQNETKVIGVSNLLMCAGVGQLNRRVARLWLAENGDVHGLRRSVADGALPFEQTQIDLAHQEWPDMDAKYIVVALSAIERSIEAYRSAYVEPIQLLMRSMLEWKTRPQKIIVVSSTRVYGADDAEIIDDGFNAETDDVYGQILLEMEKLVEELPAPSSVVRLSGIYAPGRDWLKRMALKATNESLAKNHWTNRIHIDDAARAIVFLLGKSEADSHFIVTDLKPVPVIDMYNYFRKRENVDLLTVNLPANRGKQLIPSRLEELGFEWNYPDAFSGGYES